MLLPDKVDNSEYFLQRWALGVDGQLIGSAWVSSVLCKEENWDLKSYKKQWETLDRFLCLAIPIWLALTNEIVTI